MKDELVSFETAKLAKKKGFEGWCNHWTCIGAFTLKENIEIRKYEAVKEDGEIIGTREVKRISPGQPHIALVPTQSLLQRWIREKHSLHPHITLIDKGWHWDVYRLDLEDGLMTCPKIKNLDTYEQALEAALFEALNLIK